MADQKIETKDMAIIREFMEPFKWDNIDVDRTKLGQSAELLSTCLNSDSFWGGLKASHT